jgi:peptidoglycan/LPS O-acetylase OafA/YrhL
MANFLPGVGVRRGEQKLKRQEPGNQRIKSLDGLRAVSIFIVLAAHVAETTHLRHEPYSHFVSNVGSFGVKIFFVISGFLITTLLIREERIKGRISLGMFYLRRAFRILPVAYLFIGVVAALALVEVIVLPKHNLLYAMLFAMNMAPDGTWWTGHLWSLAIEEQFYLIWPVIFLFTGFRTRVAACVGMILLSPLLRISSLLYAPPVFDRMQQSLLFEGDSLAIGCLLAVMAERLDESDLARRIVASRTFVVVPVLAVLMYGTLSSHAWPEFYFAAGDSISLVCIAASIWRVIHWQDIAHRLLNMKVLVFIGGLSYSLYIWQQIFLNAGSDYWMNAFPQNLVLAFAAALASYYLVERPILRRRTRVVNWLDGRHAVRAEGALSHASTVENVADQVSA